MQARVSRLEDDMRDVRSELKGIRDLLTEMRIELAKKPSSAALWGMVAIMLGVALAVSGLNFVIAEWASQAG